MKNKYDVLKIDNQLCFPLYACSREVIKKYTPFLDKIGLTYTQYITMMVLWERKEIHVKELGQKLFLDSGTLTPVLKKLEEKRLVSRRRSKEDERNLIFALTDEGKSLKKKAAGVPAQMAQRLSLEPEEMTELYRILYKILGQVEGR